MLLTGHLKAWLKTRVSRHEGASAHPVQSLQNTHRHTSHFTSIPTRLPRSFFGASKAECLRLQRSNLEQIKITPTPGFTVIMSFTETQWWLWFLHGYQNAEVDIWECWIFTGGAFSVWHFISEALIPLKFKVEEKKMSDWQMRDTKRKRKLLWQTVKGPIILVFRSLLFIPILSGAALDDQKALCISRKQHI